MTTPPNPTPSKVPEDIALAFAATSFALRTFADELCIGSHEYLGLDPQELTVRASQVAACHFLEKPRPERLELLRALLANFDYELLEETPDDN